MRSRTKYLIWVVLLFILSLLFCLQNPYLKKRIKELSWRPVLNCDIEEFLTFLKPIIAANDKNYPSVEYSLPKIDKTLLTKYEFGVLKNVLSKELGIFYQDTIVEKANRHPKDSASEEDSIFEKIIESGENTFELPSVDIMENYFSLKNISKKSISDVYFVVNGKDWSSVDSILSSVIDDLFDEREKALAIWAFLRDKIAHFLPPHKGHYVHHPVRLLNLFGYGICDDVAGVFSIMARKAGLKSRVWRLNGHVVAEVFYNGSWHMFDPDQGVFYLDLDNRNIAGVEEISQMPKELISRTFEPKFRNKERFIGLYRSSEDNSVEPWYDGVLYDEHKLRFILRPQEKLTFFYDKGDYWYTRFNWLKPKRYSVMIDTLNILERDTFNVLEKKDIEYIDKKETQVIKSNSCNAYILWKYNLPYPIVDLILSIGVNPSDIDKIRIYLKRKNGNWKKVRLSEQRPENGELKLSLRRLINNFNADPDYSCFIRIELDRDVNITKLVSKLKAQISPIGLPDFYPGENSIVLKGNEKYSVEFLLHYNEGKLASRPEKINLPIFPLNNEKVNLGQLWGVSWNPIKEVKEYQFIISDKSNCLFPLSPNFYRNCNSNQIYFTKDDISFFNINQTYYWKVKSRYNDEAWGQWSDIFNFEITD